MKAAMPATIFSGKFKTVNEIDEKGSPNETLQELRMLSTVTLNSKVPMLVMYLGSQ